MLAETILVSISDYAARQGECNLRVLNYILMDYIGGRYEFLDTWQKNIQSTSGLWIYKWRFILTFTIDFETAKQYRESRHMDHRFRKTQWNDLVIEVYL